MVKPAFPIFAFLTLLGGGVAIGFAGIFMRLSDVNPIASAFWRMALAAPLLWAWALATAEGDRARGHRTGFGQGLALAGVFFAADMALWHLSLHHTSIANATLLSNFAPIFIALWMWFMYAVRFSRSFLTGMILALVGAAFLVHRSTAPGEIGDSRLLGDMLGLSSAVAYAAYQLAVKGAREQYSTARLMAWSTTITAALLLPFALAWPGSFWPAQFSGWLPLLALALVAQIGGQTVIAYALAHLPASLASVSLLIQPFTAALAALVIFGETLLPMQILGAILLLLGIYLAKRGA